MQEREIHHRKNSPWAFATGPLPPPAAGLLSDVHVPDRIDPWLSLANWNVNQPSVD